MFEKDGNGSWIEHEDGKVRSRETDVEMVDRWEIVVVKEPGDKNTVGAFCR